MRVTITPGDRLVYVDGDARRVHDHVEFPPEIHAVQWYHSHGEIEYVDRSRPNRKIDNLNDFQHYVKHHAEAVLRDKKLAAEVAETERKLQEAAKFERDLVKELFERVARLEAVVGQKDPS